MMSSEFEILVNYDQSETSKKITVNGTDTIEDVKRKAVSKLRLEQVCDLHVWKGKRQLCDSEKVNHYRIVRCDQLVLRGKEVSTSQTDDQCESSKTKNSKCQHNHEVDTVSGGRKIKKSASETFEPKQASGSNRCHRTSLPSMPKVLKGKRLQLGNKKSLTSQQENPKSATRTDMSTGEHQSEVSAMTKTKSENLLTEKKQKEVHRQTRSLGNFNQAKEKQIETGTENSSKQSSEKFSNSETQRVIQVVQGRSRVIGNNCCSMRAKTVEGTSRRRFNLERPLSAMKIRSASTNDLASLTADESAFTAVEKAMKKSQAECTSPIFSNALEPFISDLTFAIQDPVVFSNRLMQEGFIPLELHLDITTTTGVTNIHKASKLLNRVQVYLRTSNRPLEVLKSFCKAIDPDPLMKEFIHRIEGKIGGIPLTETERKKAQRVRPSSTTRCEKCRISEDDVSTVVCRGEDVYRHWFLLGTVLKLKYEDLITIRSSNLDSAGGCFAEMISKWVKSSRAPTWQQLTHYIMRPIGMSKLGMELKREFCTDCCYIG